MAERIYIKAEGRVTPMNEEPFPSEDDLQALIAQHPDLLAGEQISPGAPRRWILVTREKGISESSDAGYSWWIDLLIVDQDATPTLVEVKRGKNPEIRRTVVGQMLEYAAHAAETWTETELRQTFESVNSREQDPNEVLADFLQESELDVDSFWKRVATNLEAKNIRLLFVADDIPDQLERIVGFLNAQMPRIEVLAVEIKQFRGDSGQILVPRVIGRTAAASASSTVGRPRLTRQTFLDRFPGELRGKATQLLDYPKEIGCTLTYGRDTVSIRMGCSKYQYAITLAYLWRPFDGKFDNDRGVDFTGALNPHPSYPHDLEEILREWLDQFLKDSFVKDLSTDKYLSRAIKYEDAFDRIDLLKSRFDEIVEKLQGL